ncbi:unnamed protein product [Coffea canephora]|uniref:Uncharacterized protein n=1 Tax=Coffea canephora TaxID=49390 RepID=A0A068V8G7_COFCA|nr:unnamed protein product [Coffea canephora]
MSVFLFVSCTCLLLLYVFNYNPVLFTSFFEVFSASKIDLELKFVSKNHVSSYGCFSCLWLLEQFGSIFYYHSLQEFCSNYLNMYGTLKRAIYSEAPSSRLALLIPDGISQHISSSILVGMEVFLGITTLMRSPISSTPGDNGGYGHRYKVLNLLVVPATQDCDLNSCTIGNSFIRAGLLAKLLAIEEVLQKLLKYVNPS